MPHPLAEIDRLLDGPVRAHELLTVGMAVAAPQHSTSDVAVADLRAADERDLVPSTHQSGGQLAAAWEAVRSAGLFGPRTNIVPGAGLSDEWVDRLVSVGSALPARRKRTWPWPLRADHRTTAAPRCGTITGQQDGGANVTIPWSTQTLRKSRASCWNRANGSSAS
ncbi:putative hydrolase domain protein [Mycobacterium xenopi 4042]|uniref:Putative hydrolase domain protein n=1 Tax=Mycobacterium xenopi 4042 TaxID=1299334 RepID=X7Z2W7_MYCXE|nr:putative hydrolase domain protein [Mycobacterium xenopi 4042]